MVELLADNPVLLVFVTSALGFAVGRIHVKGASLGVAAVLFVGLAIGAQDPSLVVPEFTRTIGLAIFVYTIGLASGANFFASFNRKGLRDNLLVVAMLSFAALLVVLAALAFDLRATIAAGFYAGAMTNTPALAGVIEAVLGSGAPDAAAAANEPTVGYSIAYPMGVLGPILAIAIVRRVLRIDYRAEAARHTSLHLIQEEIASVTARVSAPGAIGTSVRELQRTLGVPVVLSRIQRGDEVMLAEGDVRLREGDLVCVVGEPDNVERAVAALGVLDEHHPELDRSRYDFRRIFVSRPDAVGRRLRDLRLPEDYDAIVTRVRRGDIDVTATGDTVLELGDRVRVVAGRHRMKAVSDRLGDSYKHLSEIDLLSFGLGMSLGLLLGAIPIPLPGGLTFQLGSAAGPLVVGLVLGALRRTGPIVWNIPYSANLTLRQLGLILFLATVGLGSGYTFRTMFAENSGVTLLLLGAVISTAIPTLTLLVGYRLLRMPFGTLVGTVAAQQTQPAVLGYALEESGDEAPNVGYAMVYPVAMITKILLAQVVLVVLEATG
ncbi:MAG TPA: aspartate:alanine exchanger family transporter, partial [Actinotalea sp.]|nr:aspartate:alanine exchanger family transporter [Actinotalea sp.]